ncbi:MAG: VOC family protein [Actinomycetota bacterium]
MLLDGIHHITAITADAARNLDFYVRVLGLRLVKKTVNFDAPDLYHLYYADEYGNPGSILTFFEYPGAERGRPGAGMVHRILWRVGDEHALGFWEDRLGAEGNEVSWTNEGLYFSDPEGLGHGLVMDESHDKPLIAKSQEIPVDRALIGLAGVRAYSGARVKTQRMLEDVLGASMTPGSLLELRGPTRGGFYAIEDAPGRGIQAAGTVHHIAWACHRDDQIAWRDRLIAAGAGVTDVIDRQYFRSIYFREPGGVLFEIATVGPGFTVDEPEERLGESLKLPPQHESLRPRLEGSLVPLENPRRAHSR